MLYFANKHIKRPAYLYLFRSQRTKQT